MATSVDVNIKIGSFVAGTQTGGAFISGRPSIQTTESMEGGAVPAPVSDIPLLSVNTFTPFTTYVNGVSPQQDVILSNIGNATLTITNLTFSRRGGVSPRFYWTSSAALYNTETNTASTITILPDSTATFKLAYTGNEVGEQSNIITFFSNSVSGAYQVNTNQIINNELSFNLSTSSYTTTINSIGERAQITYTLLPIFNGVSVAIDLPYQLSISGSPAWKVISSKSNEFILEFESHDINNKNGTYEAEVTLTSSGASVVLINTATVNIPYANNYNFTKWASPKAPDNSVIGISYDLINGRKTLTIGVGIGGDNTPVYTEGGDIFYNLDTLGVGANNLDFPYSGWAEVYRFTNLGMGTAKTLLSGIVDNDGDYLYRQKVTEVRDYGNYFGQGASFGSMFTVDDLGTGDVRVYINSIRESSGDPAFDATLDNLTRAFHYYSPIDVGGRIENFVQYPIEVSPAYPVINSTLPLPPGETRTNMFTGFNSSGTTTTYNIVTSLVDIPNWKLTSSKNSVARDSTFTVNLNTNRIQDGTSIPYSIFGVTSSDINNALTTGTFVVNSESASITLTNTTNVPKNFRLTIPSINPPPAISIDLL
jgi:hypothetical protein